MFIRKKINKSGSCSILLVVGERIIGKKHPIPRVVRNFGSARTKKKIALLVRQAEEYKTNLEIASPKAKTLKIASDLDIKSCRSYNTGFREVYSPVFDSVFSKLDLKPALTHLLRSVVMMRIASPASKLKTTRFSSEYQMDCKVDSVYKLMDKINPSVTDKVKQLVCEHSTRLAAEEKKTIDVLFYDLTTIYFETSTQDEIRDFGFSKDGKHRHVQIMLAATVTTDGLPIDYKEFVGNTYEGHTLIPTLNEIKERYNIGKVVLVADAALMNKINLEELDKRGFRYIIAARIKNVKGDIRKEVLDISGYQKIYSTVNNEGGIDETKAKIIDSGCGDFLVAYHCARRARKDEHDRQKDLERIEKHLHSTAKSKLTGSLKKSYVKISKGCKIEIDPDKLALEKQYDGFFGLRTNIEEINPSDFLHSYRGLWQVEQTFRITKNDLEIRPVFHYSPRRIRAHFTICYMALALVRYIEFALKKQNAYIPYEQLHLYLDKMRVTRIIDHRDDLFEIAEDPPPQLLPIYNALKIKWPKKFGYRPYL